MSGSHRRSPSGGFLGGELIEHIDLIGPSQQTIDGGAAPLRLPADWYLNFSYDSPIRIVVGGILHGNMTNAGSAAWVNGRLEGETAGSGSWLNLGDMPLTEMQWPYSNDEKNIPLYRSILWPQISFNWGDAASVNLVLALAAGPDNSYDFVALATTIMFVDVYSYDV